MCGIFGIVAASAQSLEPDRLEASLARLFALSESRGKEAAGLAVRAGGVVDVFKTAGRASSMVRNEPYRRFLSQALARRCSGGFAAIGHSRLVTNGWQAIDDNNQPVLTGHSVGIHNGIIANVEALWRDHPRLARTADVDTEVIFRLLDHFRAEGAEVPAALARIYGLIEGVANLAFFTDDRDRLVLASNNGSLYWVADQALGLLAFASEAHILRRAVAKGGLVALKDSPITRVEPGSGLEVGLEGFETRPFALSPASASAARPASVRFQWQRVTAEGIRRCTRCVLPATFPGISFDEHGVCSQCRSHVPYQPQGSEALRALVEPYRSKDGSPDCILAFSGGRDSSYGLHYLKRELGLNPIAYTYDWGMVTDLARRNQSRLCGAMGVEHIIRSPDIAAKRRNIRLNINAWMKRPDLGMVPLFMAGDKQFYHHARRLRQETGVKLVFFCAGNALERTEFKTGFCGIRESLHGQRLYAYSLRNKVELAWYYFRQYMLNPSYWNASTLDTLSAYVATYVAKDDFVYLYHYIPWDEAVIDDTLKHEYHWETAEDAATTWRIGDGTTAFYNYIYHTVAGFSEHDTFRSNQVRAGLIDRAEALRLVERDNQPRWESMRNYAAVIGFNLEEALGVINAMPKLYGSSR